MDQSRHRFVVLIALAFVGCDNPPPPIDDGGMLPDAGPPLVASHLFGECQEDWQCPGEGAFCRSASDGWPGGYCTLPCDDRTPCDYNGVYHHCIQLEDEDRPYCERRCLNGLDCGREAYTCEGEYDPSGGSCIPVCASDEQCGAGTSCNTHSGLCTAGPVPTTGALTGEPCLSDTACRSDKCFTETVDGEPTGWVGGYCVANCILPSGFNTNNFFNGTVLPHGTCPDNAICIPNSGQTALGDLGLCLDECVEAIDCRTGYTCLKQFDLASGGAALFTNGVCVPEG